jgi:RimJ/RimL family protein N-acetyltransferase
VPGRGSRPEKRNAFLGAGVGTVEGVDELRTERVLLRRWRAEDEREMARINREPEVARYLNRPVDEVVIAGFFAAICGHWQQHGFGPWAVESLEPERSGAFLGFVGLAFVPAFLSAAGSAPELGWRLDPSVWGRGLATEASMAARDDALGRLEQPELISVIHPQNQRSQRVAVKLGMRHERQIENPALGINVDVWHLRSDQAERGVR